MELLKENKTINYLSVGQNDVGVEGAQYMAEALKNKCSIVTLCNFVNEISTLITSEIKEP